MRNHLINLAKKEKKKRAKKFSTDLVIIYKGIALQLHLLGVFL